MSVSELTAGEKAYLDSGGTDTSALLAENPAVTPATLETPVAEAPVAADPVTPAPAAEAPVPEAPEPGEEEIAAPDGKTKRRVVDSRALKAERDARKAAEAELTRYRENYTRVDERLKMLSEAVSQPDAPVVPEADDTPIDPEQDIFGAYRQLQKELASIKSSTTEMRTQTETERQTNALVSTYRQDAAQFRHKTPDFNDAYNYMLTKRTEQLELLGYRSDVPSNHPRSLATALYNEEMSLASQAISDRRSAAEHIYGLAKTMGYAKAAPVAAASPVAAAPVAPVAPAVPSVTSEIAAIKAGQNTSKTLSSGGGAAGEELSLEALANMPTKEFEAFMAKPGNRDRVEIAMGRRAA